VVDTVGNSGNVIGPQMGVLTGDVNASRRVDSGDVSCVRQQSAQRQPVTASNFRDDVNTDGFVNSGDISFVTSKSSNALP
jgi:hypothetical protein